MLVELVIAQQYMAGFIESWTPKPALLWCVKILFQEKGLRSLENQIHLTIIYFLKPYP